jgi:hypothetical protein
MAGQLHLKMSEKVTVTGMVLQQGGSHPCKVPKGNCPERHRGDSRRTRLQTLCAQIRTMITRAILLLLAMMTGLSAAEAADRSRLVSASHGVRSAVSQLLKTAQNERVEGHVGLPVTVDISAPKSFETTLQCRAFDRVVAPSTGIHIPDRPLT